MSFINKFKNTIGIIAIILSILGLVTFSQFIVEESIQTVMFGTWAAQDAHDWKTVKLGSDIIKRQTKLLDTLTKYIGWIQPLAFISYGAYGKSAGYYTKALDAKIMAHAPELFDGEVVNIKFTPKEFREINSKIHATTGNITVIVNERQSSPTWEITGLLTVDPNGQITIRGAP